MRSCSGDAESWSRTPLWGKWDLREKKTSDGVLVNLLPKDGSLTSCVRVVGVHKVKPCSREFKVSSDHLRQLRELLEGLARAPLWNIDP